MFPIVVSLPPNPKLDYPSSSTLCTWMHSLPAATDLVVVLMLYLQRYSLFLGIRLECRDHSCHYYLDYQSFLGLRLTSRAPDFKWRLSSDLRTHICGEDHLHPSQDREWAMLAGPAAPGQKRTWGPLAGIWEELGLQSEWFKFGSQDGHPHNSSLVPW